VIPSIASDAQAIAPLLPQAGHAYFGGSVNPTGTWSEAGVEAFEKTIGRTLAVDHHYDWWGQLAVPGFAFTDENADVAAGRIPLVNLNCGHYNTDIISGGADAQIVNIADNIKAFGKPMFLNYWWEMNDVDTSNNRTSCYDRAHDGTNGGTRAGYFNPTNYVAAWRHIHDIFVSQGVTNAVWVFDPDGTGGQGAAAYYPGDAYVDWMGYDAYEKVIGESFAATNDRAYANISAINSKKPIIVCETGVQQNDDQQVWLDGIARSLSSNYPKIRAWVYWDAQGKNDYILTGKGLSRFARLGATAFFTTGG
jgi:endoglucanase